MFFGTGVRQGQSGELQTAKFALGETVGFQAQATVKAIHEHSKPLFFQAILYQLGRVAAVARLAFVALFLPTMMAQFAMRRSGLPAWVGSPQCWETSGRTRPLSYDAGREVAPQIRRHAIR